MIRRTRMPRRSPSSRCVSASCAGSSWRRSTVAGSPSAAGGGDVRDGGGREETAASSGDDRSVRERRSVVRRRRTTGENNDVGGEGKHAAQVHLTALLPQPCEVEKVSKRRCEHKQDTTGGYTGVYLTTRSLEGPDLPPPGKEGPRLCSKVHNGGKV